VLPVRSRIIDGEAIPCDANGFGHIRSYRATGGKIMLLRFAHSSLLELEG